MTEHVHEWECRYLGTMPRCKVDGCGIYMCYDELERRLNATETVTRRLRILTHEDVEYDVPNKLADTLEGKDGQ